MRHRRVIIGAALLLLCAVAAVFAAGALSPGGTATAKADDPVVLTVKHEGVAVKAYTLADLKALTPYAGYAGFITSGGTVSGPDAVTGVRVADIIQDALGVAMTHQQMAGIGAATDLYGMTFYPDQILDGERFEMISTVTKKVVPAAGPLAAVIVYERAGQPLPADEGSLRFYAAQLTAAPQVMDGSLSVHHVSYINVRDEVLPEWNLKLVGLKIKGKRQIVTETRNAIEGCSKPGCHGSGAMIAGAHWTGVPLWRLMGVVDGGARHKDHSYNAALARRGYRIRLYNAAGKYVTIGSKSTVYRDSIVLANQVNGEAPSMRFYPLRLVGPTKYVSAAKRLGRIVKITMLPRL